MNSTPVKPRERDAILKSLSVGIVPRIGLQHIQVGRKDEIQAIMSDLERVRDGSASVRFIIGRYGAGKTFFLNLIRALAIKQKFIVAQADVTPDRRLHATGGQARALYSELMRNLSIQAKPEGGALEAVLSGWISEVDHEIRSAGGDDTAVKKSIDQMLKPLMEYVNSFDLISVVHKYLEGFLNQDAELQTAALRWLRAEFTTKTEAREALGVRTIIDDANIYDYLKLFAQFGVMAGYSGLVVNIDEMGVFSHRLNHAPARNSNYEMILRIVNDCYQGHVPNLAFIFAGTDGFLEDKRRGIYSYEALASRLADNRYATAGIKDYSGPVIRLANLTAEDMLVLMHRIRTVFDSVSPGRQVIGDDGIQGFLNDCARRLGADFFMTPRDAVKAFVGLLFVIEQNPQLPLSKLLERVPLQKTPDSTEPVAPGAVDDKDNLTTINL